jgi:type II secretory ATPase GspE/PulE/Tfp pilus assembly ATPase PilB-like protein
MADDSQRSLVAEEPKLVTLAEFMPLPEGDSQYPLEYMDTNSVVKLREDAEEVLVGVCEPENAPLLRSLKNFHGKPVRFFRIDRAELFAYLGRRLSALETQQPRRIGENDERILLDRLANDAPIVNLVNSLMIEAIRMGASDIHIESFAEGTRVRYRIDGVLRTVSRIEKEKFPAVASRIKIMANLNIMERRLPQDGRISVHMGGGTFDVRVSIVPIAAGESIVLRLFNTSGSPLGLAELGIDAECQMLIRKMVAVPHGLVLATGPTGSGKTTTLNAVLREIASETVKVVTIEDPVEYLIDGIGQIQTHERIGLTFESLLRRVLRQDPDVIMVGEIRDSPTAELSVRSALTGHLVLSTLHTNDAISVIPRLRNMGVEPYLLAAVLRGAMAQRLVRRICPSCAKPRKPLRDERELLKRHGLSATRLVHGSGCDACRGTGFKGRAAIVEAFPADETVEEMILKGERGSAIASYLCSKGFTTMLCRGLQMAVQGMTTVAEVESAVMS